MGTDIFADQVKNASKAGFKSITAKCVKDGHKNGYYTWARLGYDGKIPDSVKDKLPNNLSKAKTIQELISKKGGMEWWKQNGDTFEGTFDLKAGSNSRKILDEYLKQRNKSKPK